MRAVRVHALGAPVGVDELPEPEPQPGRTLVRVGASTVGHVDRSMWSGAFFRHPPLPYVPGVEAAGTVVASETRAPGQRVWVRGAGLGTVVDGTWAEVVSAPDAALGALPAAVGFELGSAFFSPCTSAWVSLHDIASARAGEIVGVTGASGAVGAVALHLALELGAEVVATVSSPEKAALLPAGVQAIVVDRAGPQLPAGLEVDVVIDTVGGPLLQALLPVVRPGGRVVLVGYLAGSDVRIDVASLVQRDVALLPLNMIRREDAGRRAAPALLERIGDGRIALPVTCFGYEDANEALDWLGSGHQVGRAVLVPDLTRADSKGDDGDR